MDKNIRNLLEQYDFINFEYERDSVFDYKFSCYKRINPSIVGKTNEKLSIVAEVWSYQGNESIKLTICGQTQNNLWIKTSFYSFSIKDIASQHAYDEIEKKLIDSWMSLNGE